MLTRLFVAAVLLFAIAESQYAGGFGGNYGSSSYNPYQIPGYKTPTPASYGGDALSGSRGGQDFTGSGIGGGLSSVAYGFHDFGAAYIPAMPYSGSPYGYPDLYPRSYYSLYGGMSQRGPPPPPANSPYGVPFGSYEPDTYASGRAPANFVRSPIGAGYTPINGYKGPLAPNPFYLGDSDDIAYKVFERLYREQYGTRYDPSGFDKPASAAPAAPPAAQLTYPAPGTNYFGYNVGLVPNYGSSGAIYPSYPTAYNNYGQGRYNGYGQAYRPAAPAPATTPAPPAATTSAPTTAPTPK